MSFFLRRFFPRFSNKSKLKKMSPIQMHFLSLKKRQIVRIGSSKTEVNVGFKSSKINQRKKPALLKYLSIPSKLYSRLLNKCMTFMNVLSKHRSSLTCFSQIICVKFSVIVLFHMKIRLNSPHSHLIWSRRSQMISLIHSCPLWLVSRLICQNSFSNSLSVCSEKCKADIQKYFSSKSLKILQNCPWLENLTLKFSKNASFSSTKI